MTQSPEAWFVRLPDGRVVRAKSADSVRHHIERGRIPPDAWVRRAGEEEWHSLEWTTEFADVAKRRSESTAAPALTPAPRGNGAAARTAHELQIVGVRGIVDELFGALDTTLLRPKLIVSG